ncbi:MAG: UbiA family prenyltransferase [Candidatus Hodarchaeales archaeon]|jgi:geranylgeranylglycerol-phosphate geranylgeranyltransferase
MKNVTNRTENNSFFGSIYGLILLARPVDGVIIGCTGVLGMIISLRIAPSSTQIIMGIIGGILLLGGMDTFNDFKDIESDRISKPWRPLPQGRVKPRIALFAAISETIGAVVIALVFFELQALFIGLIGIGLSIAYSEWLKFYKRSYLTKNFIVALSLSLALITGVFAVNPTPSIDFVFLITQLLVFITALVFEIHKDLGDIQGDIAQGVNTIPTHLGIDRTVQVLGLGYFLAWGLAFSFTFILGSDPLFLGILIFTAVLLLFVLYLLVKNPESTIELTRRLTTLVMGIILLGLARLLLL